MRSRLVGALQPLTIGALALLSRLPFMAGIGHAFDLGLMLTFTRDVYRYGLFFIYRVPIVDYPPLYLAALGALAPFSPAFNSLAVTPPDAVNVVLLKLFPVLGDLCLMLIAWFWLHKSGTPVRAAWLVMVLLALHPAILVDSAWWGQFDSLFTLFLVLSLYALHERKPLPAWTFWILALFVKFQSVALLPLLVVITLRRHGFRTLLKGIGIFVLIAFLLLTLFFFASGIGNTLRPYAGSTSRYESITLNAYNLWYLITLGTGNFDSDRQTLIGPLTYKMVGFGVLGVYTLLLCITMWQHADDSQEFAWGMAIYFGFFMLPTEIHERYLYPAAVLAILATVQDRRMWLLAPGLLVTCSYNILANAEPLPFLGEKLSLSRGIETWGIAAVNVILFFLMMRMIIRTDFGALLAHARSNAPRSPDAN